MFFIHYLEEVWNILTALAPWLFFGAGLAGLLKIFLPPGFITKHLGASSLANIVKTTLLGIPLPLCSCGVLPTTMGLKKDGASNGASLGFLISTPQTGLDSILVTANFLGWPLALFKVIAALITGMAGGFLTHYTEPHPPIISDPAQVKSHPGKNETPGEKSRWQIFFNYTINDLIGSIYKYLALGILLAALISSLFPAEALSRLPALQGIWGMLVMLALAIPLYICTTGSVPIVASLISAGLPIGSALVFLMAGPATNAATLAAVYRAFGRRITAIYLGTVILGSIAFGLLFQSFFSPALSDVLIPHHEHVPAYRLIFNATFAILLTGLIVRWAGLDFISWFRRLFRPAPRKEEELILQVSGMTCNNCVSHVRHALESLPHIRSADIRLETGLAHVKGETLDRSVIIRVIKAAGYSVADA